MAMAGPSEARSSQRHPCAQNDVGDAERHRASAHPPAWPEGNRLRAGRHTVLVTWRVFPGRAHPTSPPSISKPMSVYKNL
jgi:hypothetical protein